MESFVKGEIALKDYNAHQHGEFRMLLFFLLVQKEPKKTPAIDYGTIAGSSFVHLVSFFFCFSKKRNKKRSPAMISITLPDSALCIFST